jgi:hypothetical protein
VVDAIIRLLSINSYSLLNYPRVGFESHIPDGDWNASCGTAGAIKGFSVSGDARG